MAKQTKPCGVPLTTDKYGLDDLDGPTCGYPRHHGKTKCVWHWLLRQPIEVQVRQAEFRLKNRELDTMRMRVPAEEWPEGKRWCSGCQSYVPLFYVSGSRCKGCNSKAAHAGHVERTYGITGEQYQQLLDWQGGRCFICGQVPRVRRLAVDHDHRTGRVRGLLCSNDEHGCNVQLRRLLNDVEMAKRALAYVTKHPLDRMLEGEPGVQRTPKPDVWARMMAADTPTPQPLETDAWDPWAA